MSNIKNIASLDIKTSTRPSTKNESRVTNEENITFTPTDLTINPTKTKREKQRRKKVPKPGDPFNEVEKVILERRSIRTFQSKQVPDYLINRILETGRFAPTAGNNQSWRFIVIRDQKIIEDLAEQIIKTAQKLCKTFNPFFDDTKPKLSKKLLMRFMMHAQTQMFHPTGVVGLSQVAKGELGVFHGAPTLILLLADKRGTGDPHLDLGISGTNMCLTAHSFGLGTCWVSFANLLQYSKKHRKMLGIEAPYKIVSSLVIGYTKGIPDGMVPRETHESIWFEDGEVKSVY